MDTEHKGPFYSSKYPDLRFLSQAALNNALLDPRPLEFYQDLRSWAADRALTAFSENDRESLRYAQSIFEEADQTSQIIRAASFDELLSEKLRRKEEIHKNIHRHIGRLALEAAGIEFSTK
ncbi:hypothetical protein HYU82_01895 [Candidatus Saccharibacteria bacterium]|nr:hypothetical protein [Candidatus Saccharibacteria bacterium]